MKQFLFYFLTIIFLVPGATGAIPSGASACKTLSISEISSSVLFKKGPDGLLQAVDITIENIGQEIEASIYVLFGENSGQEHDLGQIETGEGKYRFFIAEVLGEKNARFVLKTEDGVQDSLEMEWIPGKHWEICMVPMSHHDLGYTHPIENVLEIYDNIYTDVIRYCEQTEGYPEDAKFRYTAEASWSLVNFLKTANNDTREKLAKYMKEGRFEVGAFFGNETSNMCSHEELIRLVYPSSEITKTFGGKLKSGSITDIPGLSWGLPTVLSGAGVKYFFAGLPTYFDWEDTYSKKEYPGIHTFWDEEKILRAHGQPDAFYWEGPDGSKVLLYYQGGYGCWSPQTYSEIMEELPGKLMDMESRGVPFSVMRYAGYGCIDNRPTDIIVSKLVKEWNSQWEYPKLVVSTNSMFFEKLEKQCQGIRTFRGELPSTDYVVGAISSAKETAMNRVLHDKLNSAEKLATMSSLLRDRDYPSTKIKEAYNSMVLFDEHTWGMNYQVGEVQDWGWSEKSSFAYKASGITGTILPRAADDIAKGVAFKTDGQHIVVHNTLSFNRNDIVNLACPPLTGPFSIIDTETGRVVPHQIISLNNPRSPVPYAPGKYGRSQFDPAMGYNIVFYAENVPAMGFKTYRIEQKEVQTHSFSLILKDRSIENRFFKIELDSKSGAVKSIYDKELKVELFDENAPHQLNELVTRWAKTGEEGSSGAVKIQKGQNGPVYASLIVSTSEDGCPQVTQEIILYDKIKRIDFSNRVLKDMTPLMEVYFAFPFKVDNPAFRFEGPLSVIEPFRDQLPGSNTNYYAAQHWAQVSNDEIGITFTPVDAHLVEFGGLNSSEVSQAHHGVPPPTYGSPFIAKMDKGHIYSYAINSNFKTNFNTTQMGDMLFRYSVTSGNRDEMSPRDFGWSVCTPLVPVLVKGSRSDANLPESFSFCQIDQPNVILLALKKAEDGNGIIIRVNETEGRAVGAKLTISGLGIKEVHGTDLVETNIERLNAEGQTINFEINAYDIKTFRILPK